MNFKRGFIALMSVVVLSAMLLSAVLSLNQAGSLTQRRVLGHELKNISQQAAETCFTIALVKLSRRDPTATISGKYSLNDGKCRIISLSPQGINEIIRVEGWSGNTYTDIEALLQADTGEVLSQKEFPHF